ncbi:hypothetical protein SGRIM119S_01825 [Streptomyces griseorubiginosus]
MRPWSITSMGCISTEPCACSAAFAVASASGVWKYTVQEGGPWSGPVCIPAAAVRPSSWKKPYPPASGGPGRNSQPNSPP